METLDGQKPLVLVTGVTGYVGSQCAYHYLLDGGFRVRGTLRSKAKGETLRKGFGDLFDQLELVEADLMDKASLDKAAEGCTFIAHTASPVPGSSKDLLGPAIEGTRYICEIAEKHKIKKLVITSSMAAVVYQNDMHKSYFTSADWSNDLQDDYAKAKTKAEQFAWEYQKNMPKDSRFDLVTLNPGIVVGPQLNGTADNVGNGYILSMLKGEAGPNMSFTTGWIDVRDVALAHVNACKIDAAANRRYILSVKNAIWMQQLSIWLDETYGAKGNNQFPKINTGLMGKGLITCCSFICCCSSTVQQMNAKWGVQQVYENKETIEILQVPIRDPKQSLLDAAENIIQLGLHNKKK